jgi:hypothetical protein
MMCDCPYPEVFSDRIVRAKKPYQCEECGDTIAAGEKYHSVFGVWDHEPGSYKICCNCEKLRSWLLELNLPDADCCMGQYGNLYDELVECDLISFKNSKPIAVDERLELLPCQENDWKVKVRETERCSN